MNRFYRSILLYVLILLVLVGVVQYLTGSERARGPIPYTQFVTYVKDGDISGTVQVTPEGLTATIDGSLKNGQKFETRALYDNNLEPFLANHNVSFNVTPQPRGSVWISFLEQVVPFVFLFILMFFLFNQAQGGGSRVMNFGKSRARLYSEEKRKVTFADVAGADEEKAELEEIVEFLKDPKRFSALGARIPKGVLLVGPPGTGKTLLARAVAGEAGVPFFSISGSDFVEMFVGVGASRVRDLFDNAKKNAPCIIFIDEIDAVGRHRGAGLGGGHDEREQTLNQLLVEMDGFSANEGIIIIAATNRPDILDPALLRPGRMDRQIVVNRPDVKGREEILRVHARNKPFAKGINLETIAKRTPGFTGADLENVLNEAALLAARRREREITEGDIDEAIDRVMAGPEKRSRVMSEQERRLVAFHEAGHAVVGYFVQPERTVHKVTIVPRGMAGGYTLSLPKEDRYFITKQQMLDEICMTLGGRVAEEIVFGEISTGASGDLERVTTVARQMITEYGMSDRLGLLQYGNRQGGQIFLGRDLQGEQNYSDQVAFEIDKEMRDIVEACHERTRKILTEKRACLNALAERLLEKETIDEQEVREIMESCG
ncbi:ATP-dependent zinc metalloprotease FtsH [Alicyclobacillus hesperidum subsp. aegles]|uniref:ATP-dependent zinc metalloprotease FtsH n=1 Tax=Alicyclobacillus hesperidum TaxID=89784 RepID=A0A1H2TLR2_9BACL|nr:ATP-dependent zinc metalloprotease FtsH [Alicyclobacillus hesperidum]GLG02375.1 ATP-dependent zinc metalloprotease FtsH [Alicyclobacillus hesperidum subsp. aegles]GLV13890.1 ATP-dependent zinc metalloprotease FtsH [Alicyclobacillus hesperidum]SDW44635.1 membrane protease FtsH catalytic subunit [Alicyclobacillus hesperidum]